MQPNDRGFQDTGFKPKYRQFHPQSTVWLKNPFSHDVEFQVADEQNRRFTYKLPANKVSELPGGLIATLGVKKIVDEVIVTTRDDEGRDQTLNLWDERTRAWVESNVIVKVREAPQTVEAAAPGGTINLGVKNKDIPQDEAQPDDADEAEAETVGDDSLDDEEFAEIERSDSHVVGGPPLPLDEAELMAKGEIANAATAAVGNLPAAAEVDG